MKTYEQLQNDIDDGNNPRIDDVWNAAIIAAASLAQELGYQVVAAEIRDLKK